MTLQNFKYHPLSVFYFNTQSILKAFKQLDDRDISINVILFTKKNEEQAFPNTQGNNVSLFFWSKHYIESFHI